jgi:quercetin dioxygenase-like cupin family protein
MIHRKNQTGQKLDVAGLNEITVLVDRSETELTEVAMNAWTPGLDGPPHAHNRKEQNFLVTAGQGTVKIGSETFPAEPGDFFYVPAGVVHQTITKGRDRLVYFLFNAFLDADKEGHATFAEHIALVKETRRQQAAAQRADVSAPVETGAPPPRPGRRIATAGLTAPATVILPRGETERCETVHHRLPAGARLALAADGGKEQTFYVLAGTGRITAGRDTAAVSAGDVVFIPRHTTGAIEAGPDGLQAVSFGTVVQR